MSDAAELREIVRSIRALAARVRALESIEYPVVAGGSGGAPLDASYLTVGFNSSLTGERRIQIAGGYTEGARVRNSANTSISTGTWTTLTYDTEDFDTDDIHSTGLNTDRLTCKTAGKYLITLQVYLDKNSGNWCGVDILKNGTRMAIVTHQPNMSVPDALVVSTVIDMLVDDYVQSRVNQNSGSSVNMTGGVEYSPVFSMMRVG
jgi:hypothetical protein